LSDTAKSLAAGSYLIVVTDANGCRDTSSATVLEPDSLTVMVDVTDTICIGQSEMLDTKVSGGTPGYVFHWTPSLSGNQPSVQPLETSIYTVYVTDANGCISAPESMEVQVRPPLEVSATVSGPACSGSSVSLYAKATGGDQKYDYVWQPGQSEGDSVKVAPTATTTYTVSVSDGCGTPKATDTVTAIIHDVPDVDFSGNPLKGCIPLSVSFSDRSQLDPSSSISSWSWNFGNGDNSSLQNPTAIFDIPGIYSITLAVVSSDGCADTLTRPAYVMAYPWPEAGFVSSPESSDVFRPHISFFEQASGESSYRWDFGDGSFSNEPNPQHIYATAGNYEVCLVVTSPFGCSDTICRSVIVEEGFAFYIPNAFTPDGDGLNEYFGGSGIGITAYNLRIFDRWGNTLFSSDDMYKPWDGRANGGADVAQNDVYVYLVTLKDVFGKEHKYIGRVTLIR
jgi:gliding motility-associated-like protein